MAQETPQVKKIKDLRSTGLSLREIAERLKIKRIDVENALSKTEGLKPAKKQEVSTSVKKVTKRAKKTEGS